MRDLHPTHQRRLPGPHLNAHITGHTTEVDTLGLSAEIYFHINSMKTQQFSHLRRGLENYIYVSAKASDLGFQLQQRNIL